MSRASGSSRTRVTLVALAALVCTACSPGVDTGDAGIDLATASAPGYLDDVCSTVFLSRGVKDPDPDAGAMVAFVGCDGGVDLLPTGTLENGTIAVHPKGAVTFSSEYETFLVGGDRSPTIAHEQEEAWGHWAGATADGFVTLFEGGGVLVTPLDGEARSFSMPAEPGSVGVDDQTVYAASSPSTAAPRRRSIDTADLESGEPGRRYLWTPWGAGEGWRSTSISDLFVRDGMLYFLEDVHLTRDEQQTRAPDGSLSTVRLGSIDLASGAYASRRVMGLDEPSLIEVTDPPATRSVARAAIGSHLDDGRLYTVDSTGRIIAVDVDTARPEVLGEVSAEALEAGEILADWNGSALDLLLLDDGSITQETYDLTDGSLVRSTRLPELAAATARNPVLAPYDFAVVPRA